MLFGSRATGKYKPGSDIDLAIMNTDFEEQHLSSVQAAFEDSDLPYFTDVLFFFKLQNEGVKEQIKATGKYIYIWG